ncbi:MFS transporter [Halobacillus salinarum]|uniref:MFS transporter n=1 Tax=Halobacillus salinarum TaxID=2932257 RepID=A0ABY4ERV6_9BACI|nr:MFS transporter [Halobacillus salinarum]UOQ44861.1 MFS transporter [Halobacillus salinarum]
MFVHLYEYQINPENVEDFLHLQADVARIYQEYIACDFLFLQDMNDRGRWMEMNEFPSHTEYIRLMKNINDDSRIAHKWQEVRRLCAGDAFNERSFKTIRTSRDLLPAESFAKLYRYTIDPEKIDQYLHIQADAGSVYDQYIRGASRHLHDLNGNGDIVELQCFSSKRDYDSSMETVNETEQVQALWEEFLQTLTHGEDDITEESFIVHTFK